MDKELVEKIVTEVKSQGVFDEFRRNSIADVDTKPAYQNLRQRVENTVKKFLSEQKWSPDINKIQLRERIRKHITDSGFLDVGVERIVAQVVNPKIGKVFQPKIEDIAYKYLGVPKPTKVEAFTILHQLPSFPINGNSLQIDTSHLLPNDLEQISPDSDKGTVKSDCRDDYMGGEMENKTDDEDESPPFEPIENSEATPIKKNDWTKRDLIVDEPECNEHRDVNLSANTNSMERRKYLDFGPQDASTISQKTDEQESDKDTSHHLDIFQESHSQLSHDVSSNSCLSVESRDIHNESVEFNNKSHDNAVNISEEAQMPRFNENSNEENTNKSDKNNELHFDIKQDEIKFEGTKRNLDLELPEIASQMSNDTNKNEQTDVPIHEKESSGVTDLGLFQEKNNSHDHNFKFTKICVENEVQQEPVKETSLDAFQDDSVTAQLCIVDKSENTQLSSAGPNLSLAQRSDDRETESVETPKASTGFSNSDSNFRDKLEETSCGLELTINVSPSTSRYKKNSKKKSEKEKYREKDREKDKERFRGKVKSVHRSGSRHSSNPSKSHHSSSKPSSSGGRKDTSIVTSQPKSKHSSHSRSRDESKRSGRDSEKRQHSSSSTQPPDDKEKKTVHQSDDHYASKDKLSRRKSTDSNDDDKGPENVMGKTNNKSSDSVKSATSLSEKSKSKNENRKMISSSASNTVRGIEGSKQANSLNNDPENILSKIVILNEVLENPSTDFIELGVASQESCINIVRSEDKTDDIPSEQSNSEDELYFFEENTNQFRERLKLIDNAIERCRTVVNALRFGSISPPITDFSMTRTDIMKSPSSHLIPTGTKRNLNFTTRATLHIDCIQYTKTPHGPIDFDEKPDNKRLKYRQNETKLGSPASSDASVNSKENEFISTDISGEAGDCLKKSISLVEKRNSALSKLNQQRYTNDDLYKPRLCLGQRSRRRGLLDTVI